MGLFATTSRAASAEPDLRTLFASVRRIAVLGIKPDDRDGEPAHYVPAYLARVGYTVIPVPVYYPEVTHILGQPVVRRLAEIVGGVDLVDVFRRSQDIPPHLDDLLAAKPKYVWFQQGIRHDAVAERLRAAGIEVVQDRCIMVEHRHHGPGAG